MDESSMFGKADSFLDYVIIGAGIYLIYAGVIMKVAGRIPKSLISRNIDVENAPNKDEYINNALIILSEQLGLSRQPQMLTKMKQINNNH